MLAACRIERTWLTPGVRPSCPVEARTQDWLPREAAPDGLCPIFVPRPWAGRRTVPAAHLRSRPRQGATTALKPQVRSLPLRVDDSCSAVPGPPARSSSRSLTGTAGERFGGCSRTSAEEVLKVTDRDLGEPAKVVRFKRFPRPLRYRIRGCSFGSGHDSLRQGIGIHLKEDTGLASRHRAASQCPDGPEGTAPLGSRRKARPRRFNCACAGCPPLPEQECYGPPETSTDPRTRTTDPDSLGKPGGPVRSARALASPWMQRRDPVAPL